MKISTGTSGWSIGSYTNYSGVGYVSSSVPSSSALEHSAMVRGNESIAAAIARGAEPAFVLLAPDGWSVATSFLVDRSCTIRGGGYGTLVEAEIGVATPFFTISADNVTIQGVRFKGGSGVTECLHITGTDVTIRDCIFDGFATSIHVDGAARFIIEGCRFVNQTNAIDVDNGDGGIISGNLIQSSAPSQILLDANSQRNSVCLNNAGTNASAVSISTSGGQGNVKAGNQPAAVTT